jgi:hypothetical protein
VYFHKFLNFWHTKVFFLFRISLYSENKVPSNYLSDRSKILQLLSPITINVCDRQFKANVQIHAKIK